MLLQQQARGSWEADPESREDWEVADGMFLQPMVFRHPEVL